MANARPLLKRKNKDALDSGIQEEVAEGQKQIQESIERDQGEENNKARPPPKQRQDFTPGARHKINPSDRQFFIDKLLHSDKSSLLVNIKAV